MLSTLGPVVALGQGALAFGRNTDVRASLERVADLVVEQLYIGSRPQLQDELPGELFASFFQPAGYFPPLEAVRPDVALELEIRNVGKEARSFTGGFVVAAIRHELGSRAEGN